MSASVQAAIDKLLLLGYVVAPISWVWGWIRWTRGPKLRDGVPGLSLIGFTLATASAFLALSTIFHAYLIRGFGHDDPALLRVFRAGALLSPGGMPFGGGEIWRASSRLARAGFSNSDPWRFGLSGSGGIATLV